MTTVLEKSLPFAPYAAMSDEQAQERILAARSRLGEEAASERACQAAASSTCALRARPRRRSP